MENNKSNNMSAVLGDALKLAANLSEVKKDISKPTQDQSNNANPNQAVQIAITQPEARSEDKKPVIIKEKPETHIHKEFPDERPLTDKECELALKKAEMEHHYKMEKLESDIRREDIDRENRIKREAYEREQREKREAKNERFGKIMGTILAALGIGVIGYSVYTDYRRGKSVSQVQRLPAETSTVAVAEGEVK